MLPLAKLWTWVGHLFVPLAIGWAYFISGGSEEGVLISRGYWGLALSLLVGFVLASTLSLYVWKARLARVRISAPPNTTFEDENNRNAIISWATVVLFGLLVVGAIIDFGNRYASSRIYPWESAVPLADSFWGSRAMARASTCQAKSCFAMGQRVYANGKAIDHVDQYFPYLTDGLLGVLTTCLLGSLLALRTAFCRRIPEPLKIDL
jgi:hypothetical protein